MRAIVSRRAGSPDQLKVVELPTPQIGAGDVLVAVQGTSVTRGDIVLRRMPRLVVRLFGETPKTVLGHEFAGTVAAVGTAVGNFEVGDRVFGTTAGLRQGSHAEFVAIPADGVMARLPDSVAILDAATVPVAAMTALHLLRSAGVGPGSRVLVNGASGSVGSFAVQMAVDMGADVTGVASGRNLDFVRQLGAHDVIDYTTQRFTDRSDTWDVVVDAAGTSSAKGSAPVLSPGGRFVTTKTRRSETVEELETVRGLLAEGRIRAIADRRFSLEDVPEAHRLVEAGKRGNVLVVVA